MIDRTEITVNKTTKALSNHHFPIQIPSSESKPLPPTTNMNDLLPSPEEVARKQHEIFFDPLHNDYGARVRIKGDLFIAVLPSSNKESQVSPILHYPKLRESLINMSHLTPVTDEITNTYDALIHSKLKNTTLIVDNAVSKNQTFFKAAIPLDSRLKSSHEQGEIFIFY